jgi:hypothetical protein
MTSYDVASIVRLTIRRGGADVRQRGGVELGQPAAAAAAVLRRGGHDRRGVAGRV